MKLKLSAEEALVLGPRLIRLKDRHQLSMSCAWTSESTSAQTSEECGLRYLTRVSLYKDSSLGETFSPRWKSDDYEFLEQSQGVIACVHLVMT